MTWLSCHRFRSNDVRLWLRVIAYNLGNLWRRLGAAEEDRRLVLDELAATASEDGRTISETRPLQLAAIGRESSDAATVWKHGAADRRAAPADWIERGGGQANRSKEGGRRRGV